MNYESEFECYSAIVCIEEEGDDDLMTWTEPQHSKSAVGKAGRRLVEEEGQDGYTGALAVLDNWRTSHACPLNSIQTSLRYRGKKISKDALISQRLKRISSIKGKLKRSEGMQLHRMQDIGGCRATMPSVEEVYLLQEAMTGKRLRSECIKEIDYIKDPKPSGYRGIHMIYKFQGKKHSGHNGLLIEVQIRSAIQHAWATSVEIAGTFLGVSLKSEEGPGEWLDFFSLVSTLFAAREGYAPNHLNSDEIQGIKQKVISLRDKLSIVEQLKAFSVVTKESNNIEASDGYFLLELRVDEKIITIRYYQKDYLDKATEEYIRLEEGNKNNDVNIVLVAAESLTGLKKSYPNYFADSEIFISVLEECLKPIESTSSLSFALKAEGKT